MDVSGSWNKTIPLVDLRIRFEEIRYLCFGDVLDIKFSGGEVFSKRGKTHARVYTKAYSRIFSIFDENIASYGEHRSLQETLSGGTLRGRAGRIKVENKKEEEIFNLNDHLILMH